jgi:hypothetical protein
MAAELVTKIFTQITGLGADKTLPNRALASDAPTQANGPYQQVVTTTAKADLISVISGQLIQMTIKALSSGLYVNPLMSTPIQTACFVPEGQANVYTYKTGTSAWPWFEAQTARAVAEILFAAVS